MVMVLLLVEVVVVMLVVEAVRHQVRVTAAAAAVLHGDRDGRRGRCAHRVYVRAWRRRRLAPEVRCPAVGQAEVPVHQRRVARVGRAG